MAQIGKLLGDASECPSWLHTPFQVAQQAGARWKEIALAPFSQIVYLLVIPPKHKLVRLIQAVDWDKIDEMVAEVYENGKRGARAYAPQVLFRMLLLMALYGVCFESQLVRWVAFNIVWHWFCGFGLLTRIPTAATLCNFRKRLGPERFEMILRWLIQQCYEARLINFPHAWGDLSARVGTLSQSVIICGYQVGYLVDSAYNIIIGVVPMAANEAQAPQVKKVLDKTKRVLGGLPQRLGSPTT
jgi:transposase